MHAKAEETKRKSSKRSSYRHIDTAFAEQQQPQAEQRRTLIFWFFFLPYTCFSETYRIIVVFCSSACMSCFQLNLSLLYLLR